MAVPDYSTETFDASVQMIFSVVDRQRVFDSVQREFSLGDAIGHASHCRSHVRITRTGISCWKFQLKKINVRAESVWDPAGIETGLEMIPHNDPKTENWTENGLGKSPAAGGVCRGSNAWWQKKMTHFNVRLITRVGNHFDKRSWYSLTYFLIHWFESIRLSNGRLFRLNYCLVYNVINKIMLNVMQLVGSRTKTDGFGEILF